VAKSLYGFLAPPHSVSYSPPKFQKKLNPLYNNFEHQKKGETND